MSYSLNGSSNDPRVAELRKQHQHRLSRFFITFAIIEGIVMLAGIAAVSLLEIVEPEQGVWLLLAIALIGGLVMSVRLMSMTRRHGREMKDLTGH
jgi:ABC-type cobalamin transport system permease subunit